MARNRLRFLFSWSLFRYSLGSIDTYWHIDVVIDYFHSLLWLEKVAGLHPILRGILARWMLGVSKQ
jgi:hypothetical protein